MQATNHLWDLVCIHILRIVDCSNTAEPVNNGHIGTRHFVLYSELFLLFGVFNIRGSTVIQTIVCVLQIYPDREGLNVQAEKYTPRRNQLITRRKVNCKSQAFLVVQTVQLFLILCVTV